jgi:chaperonin GroEL (HSP60 family)
MRAEGVFDPLAVKRQVIRAATESAAQILRADFVLAKKLTNTDRYKGGSQG